VLGFYLDSLRDKMRTEEVEAGAARPRPEEEVRQNPPTRSATQTLYELMARPIQRAKLAQ